jgi:hypothetical protein
MKGNGAMRTGNTSRRLAALTAALALASAACGDDDTDTATTDPPAAESRTVPPPSSGAAVATTEVVRTAAPSTSVATAVVDSVLFTDDLVDDRHMWGEVDDPQHGTAKFVDGDYVWEFRGSNAHWLPGVLIDQYDAGDLRIPDAAVTADLTIHSGGGVAGVFCREAVDTDAEFQWYEFVVRDGYAAIRLSDTEGNIQPLAETRDVSVATDQPISIIATCRDNADGQAELALALNGEVVAETVVDDPLPVGGLPGMQAWTFPVHEQMDITWHRFEIAALTAP